MLLGGEAEARIGRKGGEAGVGDCVARRGRFGAFGAFGSFGFHHFGRGVVVVDWGADLEVWKVWDGDFFCRGGVG